MKSLSFRTERKVPFVHSERTTRARYGSEMFWSRYSGYEDTMTFLYVRQRTDVAYRQIHNEATL